MMKNVTIIKVVFIFFAVNISIKSNGQTIFYVNKNVVIGTNETLFVNGSIHVDKDGSIDNRKEFIITDSVKNNGADQPVFAPSSYGRMSNDPAEVELYDSLKLNIGTVRLNGKLPQNVIANGIILFSDLSIENDICVVIHNKIHSLGNVNFVNGNLNLNNEVLQLYYQSGDLDERRSGDIFNESDVSRVIDSTQVSNTGMTDMAGYIEVKKRTLNNNGDESLDSIGLINYNTSGIAAFRRYHFSDTMVTEGSLQKLFQLIQSDNVGDDIDMTINYLNADLIPGTKEDSLMIWSYSPVYPYYTQNRTPYDWIYFPSVPDFPNDTVDNLISGEITLQQDYIYTLAPVNCDDLPPIGLEDSIHLCTGSMASLEPFADTNVDWRNYFYKWNVPETVSSSIENEDNSVYEYTFIADSSMLDSVFKIWVDVRDVKGCRASDTVIVTIVPGSQPALKLFDPVHNPQEFAICAGESFFIQDTTNNDGSDSGYTWWFGSDTLYNQTNEVFYSLDQPGDTNEFYVQYTNVHGCVAKKRGLITVHPYPEINMVANGPLCQGALATIANNTTIPPKNPVSSIVSYKWFVGGIDSIYVNRDTASAYNSSVFESKNVSIGNQNPDLAFLFENNGDIEIALSATSGFGCVSSDTSVFYINPAVKAHFDTSGLNNVCIGSPSLFFPGDSCATGNDINCQWDFVETRPSESTDTAWFTFGSSGLHPVELIVTSDSGCTDNTIRTVLIHPNAVASFSTENQCIDTLSLTVFEHKQEPGYRYYWNYGNGTTDSVGSVIYGSAGTYDVSLKAINRWNCIDSVTHSLEIYPLPDISFTSDSGACINAQNQLFQNTSQDAVSYYWNFGDGTFSTMENPDKRYNRPGIMPVSLQGTSSNGCVNQYNGSIVVYDINKALFNPVSASVCEGEPSAFISQSDLTNLQQIHWLFGDGNSQIAADTNPDITYEYAEGGAYEAIMVTVTDMGCTDTASSIVTIAFQPNITIETEGQTCENSEIVFGLSDNSSVEDIVSYQWNFGDLFAAPGNNTSIAPTASHFYSTDGNYNVTLSVISQRGCRGSDTLAVQIDSLPEILFGDETSTCATTLDLIAGPVTLNYLWSDGSTQNFLHVIDNGLYSVTATDPASGCSNRKETRITLSSEVNPGLADSISACDIALLDAHNPGGTYNWSTGATSRTISVSTSGTYWVEVADINGCPGSDTINVTINPSPEVNLPVVLQGCEDEDILLDPGIATGSFEWSTGSTANNITVNTPGYYWVKVADINGCNDNALVNVIINPNPVVFLGNDKVVCEDKTITISAGNPGAAYLWSTGEQAQAISPQITGTYYVDVVNQHGCSGSDTVNVQINPLPIIDLGTDQSLCEKEELVLDGGAGYEQYYWSTNEYSRLISVNEPGTYWVRVTDINNCTAISPSINVEYRGLPDAPFDKYEYEACNYVLIDAGNAGSTYLWSDGNTGRNNLIENSGVYWVDITNNLDCSIRDSVEIIVNPMAILSLDNNMEICSNGSGIIDAGYFGGDYSYKWNTGSTEQYIKVSAPGKYMVDVIHTDGCIATDSVFVSTMPAPDVDLGSDVYLCANSEITLDAGEPGSTYFWNSSSGMSSFGQQIQVTDTGKYWAYVVAENGCAGTDTIEVIHTNMSIEPLFLCASRIRVGDTVCFIDLSMPEPDGHYWDFGDMVASSEKEPSHIFYQEDTFNVSLTVTNEVCSATIKKPLEVKGYNPEYLRKLSGEMQQSAQGFIKINMARVYPVPAVDYITISIKLSEQADMGMFFYDMSGRIIEMQKFDHVEQVEQNLNISGLQTGIYFIRFVTRNEAKTFKVLKVN